MRTTIKPRRPFAGLIVAVMITLGVTMVAAPSAVAVPFSCITYQVSINWGLPIGAPGLGVALNFQFASTTMRRYSSDGIYTEPAPVSSGTLLDAVIDIPGWGTYTIPANGMPQKITLPWYDYRPEITVGTDPEGCAYVTIVRVPI